MIPAAEALGGFNLRCPNSRPRRPAHQEFQFLKAAWTKLRAANFELLVRNRRTRPMFPTIARNCGRQLNHVSAMLAAEEIAEFFHSGVVKANRCARQNHGLRCAVSGLEVVGEAT